MAAVRALPENQRGQPVLTVLDVYREPMTGVAGSPIDRIDKVTGISA
jgi:fatty acid CoA ligase FadD9